MRRTWVVTRNRLVLIKACRGQPRAAPSHRSSVGRQTSEEDKRKRALEMRLSDIAGQGRPNKHITVEPYVTATPPTLAVRHLKPCVELKQWIYLISCLWARKRGTNQWKQLVLLCVLSMNTCSVMPVCAETSHIIRRREVPKLPESKMDRTGI